MRAERIVESRRAARRAVDVPCSLVRADHSALRVRLFDLSPFGLCVATRAALEVGEEVTLAFSPPRREREVRVSATVKHVVTHPDGGHLAGMELSPACGAEAAVIAESVRGLPPRLPAFAP